MAKNSRRKSDSSASGNKRPVRRKAPATNIKKIPASRFAKGRANGQRTPSGQDARPLSASGMQPSVVLEGQTIGQIRQEQKRLQKAEERRERSKKRMRKARIPFIILGIILSIAALLVGSYIFLLNTDVLKIETINIEGTDHLTKQEVSALVSVPQGTTLLTLDEDAIVSSLERDAWVESVDVNKVLPNQLQIVVHERTICAVAEIPMGEDQTIQDWAISRDGHWLMAIPDRNTELGAQISEQIHQDADSVLHITGLQYGIQPEIGAKCTDPEVLNALEIIANMTTSLSDQVKLVSAPDVDSTMLSLKNNIEVAFGQAEDIRDKERICLQIMKDNPKVVYINVRVLDRPTWRSA